MRDSCGTGGQVRHLYVKRTNVAHRLPRGKRVAGAEINFFQDHLEINHPLKLHRYRLRF
ncbi:hypothetical protein [Fictibacillus sp. UD]|uniref:hypothetical protein n=1 Tax=Fictibacillus sp. UD TaxID=3038777 RepID=UPI003747C4D0